MKSRTFPDQLENQSRTQSDSLCLDASLAVVRADLWMKSLEDVLQSPLGETVSVVSTANRTTGDCNCHVSYQAKDVVCIQQQPT